MVLNCHLPTTRHINYIGLSWHGSLITLLRLQLMVCFTHISCKTETGKNRNLGFLCKTEAKSNRKWNRRTVTALQQTRRQTNSPTIKRDDKPTRQNGYCHRNRYKIVWVHGRVFPVNLRKKSGSLSSCICRYMGQPYWQ